MDQSPSEECRPEGGGTPEIDFPQVTIAIDSNGTAITGTLREVVRLLADERELRAVRHILNAVWEHPESPHVVEFLTIVDNIVHRGAA